MSEAGGEVTETHARVGYPDAEIVDLAEEMGAGLIVMGSRGLGGLRRALMGSVSDSVVRHAHCPVIVVRWQNEGTSEHEADFLTQRPLPSPHALHHKPRWEATTRTASASPVAGSRTSPRPRPAPSLDCDIQRSMIVAVAAMRMVQVTDDKVVCVVPVRHSFVATVGAMLVACRNLCCS